MMPVPIAFGDFWDLHVKPTEDKVLAARKKTVIALNTIYIIHLS